ncbi:unnamed protein product [Polarella glacialis]|uniref:Uncharacterized protein n=1 Tax=Polarella glacialis TaxID=89957 RepID=A0A813KVR7_POLGL|nr:unnamed protein product [Polarella glacialis]CAE8713108.1 unnamed protein product [Polarella glacialis]CAE8732523.1 unnamed protein product [Polarella glacialis]
MAANVAPTPMSPYCEEGRSSLGPRIGVFFHNCLQQDPHVFIFVWVVGGLVTALVCGSALQHAHRLSQKPVSLMRGYYLQCLIFPVTWSLSAYFTLLCPRTALLAELMQGISEASVIANFSTILFMILCYESHRSHPTQRDRNALQSPLASDAARTPKMVDIIIEALAKQGPKPHFAVPPFFCCFVSCFRRHDLGPKHLLRVSWLVRQYVYVMFGLSIFGMWVAMSWPPEPAEHWKLIMGWVLKVSGLTAIYGLFVLYRATHDLLHEWNTTVKFFSIKFVILLSNVQHGILRLLIEKFRKKENSCLIEPGHPDNFEHVVNFWNQFLVLLETILMICLLRRAFPVEELKDMVFHHIDLVELELVQSSRTLRMSIPGSNGDSEDSTSSAED